MSAPVPAEDASNLRLNRRRAVILRWWLLAALGFAVSLAPTLLDLALPQLPMLVVVALMAGFNAALEWRMRKTQSVGASELFGELCVDLAALAILLYLSGGAANPLISFLLVPVAVAALSLPVVLTATIAFLAVTLYTFLMWHFLPLAVADAERAARLHLAGMWLTFVVSTAMIAWFVARMTASIRERDDKLNAAREQALRDERIVALGAQAAGAAHELGTPLATIAVLVGELEREPGLDAAAREDLALVRDQVAQCKRIIGAMAARAGTPRPDQLRMEEAGAWLEGVRARWHAMRPHAASRLILEGGAGPLIAAEATLEQAVVNLLNNAADAGDAEIDITLIRAAPRLTIAIQDRGPGFAADVLRLAGRTALPARGGGAGIGLLLAFSAVERLGGRIVLENPPHGGARATIELPVADQGHA